MSTYTYGADGRPAQRERAGHYVTTALSDALIAEVTFAEPGGNLSTAGCPSHAPGQPGGGGPQPGGALPCPLALLAFSLLVRGRVLPLSGQAHRPHQLPSRGRGMAELDFQWKCGETRRDEIGALGRSLDEMAERPLRRPGRAGGGQRGPAGRHGAGQGAGAPAAGLLLRRLPRAQDPRHHPEGATSGMLDGVGVYRDREKYLARSLQVAGRMEALVGELLAVSRMGVGRRLPAGRRWSCPP